MDAPRERLATIAGQWLRLGVTGYGGPPAHIALLHRLTVQRRHWLSEQEFTDGIAATNLLPGPASTQLAIYCGWRLRGWAGALIGGVCFIVPGLIIILVGSVALLGAHPHPLVQGAAAGAGAAVAAVALQAAASLMPASWRRASSPVRWVAYLGAGLLAAALIGAALVLVLITCGLAEIMVQANRDRPPPKGDRPTPKSATLPLAATLATTGGIAALCWVALKVGALSYGGGFVIIPLMQTDAVQRYHWLSAGEFLAAVALGQITPGPVVLTVAVVGYAAAGLPGALLATTLAFAPSFVFVMLGARHFDRLRANPRVQAFLTGAGPAAIGAIAGSSIPLALALSQPWQYAVLALAAVWLLALRRGVVSALVASAMVGLLIAL